LVIGAWSLVLIASEKGDSMSAASAKDTIYIDIDDEITSIIDKVTASNKKIVALVLPKRATTLQSIVNMKLLKRTATETKKNIVLITSEAGLLPLAGAVGLHVAKTLDSKPFIPSQPDMSAPSEDVVSEEALAAADPAIDASKPVGELAGLPPEDDAIEVDNEDKKQAAAAGTAAVATGAAAKAAKKDKKLKIPNFERFRTRLLLGAGALILLIVGLFIMGRVLPKANITIKTDTSSLTSTIEFTASTQAEDLDLEQKVVPAELKEVRKTEAEKVPATGQKDVGEKAKGTVKLFNCNKEDKLEDRTRNIPAGTGISSGDYTFILSKDVEVEPSSFSDNICQKNRPSDSVAVIAQKSGDQYNLSPRTYNVAGLSSISAEGSAMTGGTSKMVKVVSQQDVDTAKQKINDRIGDDVAEEVKQELQDGGLYGIAETFKASDPEITASPAVGEEASEVTVTSIANYSMLGVKEDALKKLIEETVKDQIDPEKQQIIDTGLEKAVFRVLSQPSPEALQLSLQTVVVAGPNLDTEGLKREIAGKKRGETQTIIESRPGIRDVTIDYSPFWVFSTPNKPSKINITFEQQDSEQ
jgi:hypothetical protein